ncbi:aspartate-semialdehyde dehydrogenase [Rickettsiales endosymbiont of Peranema trichophorum]|uniref:aspartate-semialdehyde dehydrogenase n=1 Tax=Rickettsiales endosymbiont of Peranema trichophorum TaxID=2486577 RepID=UPI001023D01B|nr:aspartate-semialdehyde dehydrogenase [Rickettsiales endosymbiont of Peranema trichophorum]RZI46316.1 aspartate-semialdehyde dehydrogenase [Rickettsiales endosymbiont of Peranema trichophorum]
MSYKVAVVGATGNVGREMLKSLADRSFPVSDVVALASKKSSGKKVSFGDEVIQVQDLNEYDFQGTDIALFSAGGEVSSHYAPIAADAGCVVIDNSSHFRMDLDVPLVVPEVNHKDISYFYRKNIIANPNCSTIQLVMALKPLHDLALIKRVVVSTYQSVSGAGKDAMDELYNQTKAKYMNSNIPPQKFTKRIAFNLIPHIDVFMEDNYTKEEWKMRVEVKKILDPQIELSATCVRVPVFIGHSEAVNIEFEKEITPLDATACLRKAEGIVVVDEPKSNSYITPAECVGEDAVYVSRIRRDDTIKHGINMWIVSDNLKKGAALNAVQIAEVLVKKYL